jgi:hypothetical protein
VLWRPVDRVRSDSDQAFVPVHECGEARGYLAGLQAAGSIIRWNARPEAALDRSAWEQLASDTQSTMIWNLAKAATCYDRAMDHAVRIVDKNGAIIRVQRVSLDLKCHGDRIDMSVWYRC